MKRLLLIFPFLCAPIWGQALVGQLVNDSASSGVGLTYSIVGVGNLLVLCAAIGGSGGAETISFTVTNATTPTNVTGNLSGISDAMQCYWSKTTATGSSTVTPTSGFGDGLKVKVAEFSGMNVTSPIDGTPTHATATGANPAPGAITTANTDLVIGFVIGGASGYTAGAGYTLLPGQSGCTNAACMEYQLNVSAGTPNPVFTASSFPYLVSGFALIQAGGPPPSVVSRHRGKVID